MKKDLIFAPILFAIGVALFFLQLTGMTAHIIVSVVGVLALIAYAILTKKEWKLPILEIGMRVCYGVALISGIIVLNVDGLTALAIIHKALAALFLASLIALLVHKISTSEKA